MKDALLTIRVPRTTRARIEALARKEGRSLSQQAERLLEAGLAEKPRLPGGSLADALRSARVPDLGNFRKVRRELSRSLARRTRQGP